jgi:tRNA threonylcarbamoyladenosine biosynthesis protein TsaE
MPEPLQEKIIQISSKTELPFAADEFLAFIGQKKVILFEGEMAAGKTTFIKAICAKLGVEEHVNSPTFALVNEYATANGELIYHFDFYRIDTVAEALDMGALEYFSSGNLCLVEWPSKVSEILPDEVVEVCLETGETEEARIISMRLYGGYDRKDHRV